MVVLGVDVTTKVNSALERPGAGDARERSEAGVFATVSDEVRRLTERFAALATYVRLLTCSHSVQLNSISRCQILL